LAISVGLGESATDNRLVYTVFIRRNKIRGEPYTRDERAAMPPFDFTLEQLLVATAVQTEQIVAEHLSSFWDNNLAPVLEEMQDDIAVIKDIVKGHSFRITRLERHNGLRP